jgi:hypothetical protein
MGILRAITAPIAAPVPRPAMISAQVTQLPGLDTASVVTMAIAMPTMP